MKQILWHDAAKELPQEDQFVACIRKTANKENSYDPFLASFINGQFTLTITGDNYFSKDNKLAMSCHIKMTLQGIVAWADANELFNTADKLLGEIKTN